MGNKDENNLIKSKEDNEDNEDKKGKKDKKYRKDNYHKDTDKHKDNEKNKDSLSFIKDDKTSKKKQVKESNDNDNKKDNKDNEKISRYSKNEKSNKDIKDIKDLKDIKDDKDRKEKNKEKERKYSRKYSRSKSRSPYSKRHYKDKESKSSSYRRRDRTRHKSRSRSRSKHRSRNHKRYSRSRSRSRSRSYTSKRDKKNSSKVKEKEKKDNNGSLSVLDQVSLAANTLISATGAGNTVNHPFDSLVPQGHLSSAAPLGTPSTTQSALCSSLLTPSISDLMAKYPTLSLQDIIARMQQSTVHIATAASMKPARELYVGNLPPNVTAPQLQEFLGTIIQQVGLTTSPGNSIVHSWISVDGHFAFCEMRTVEECNLALMLNGLTLLGQPLKFGRPKSFTGPPQHMPILSSRTQTALVNMGCTPNPIWFLPTMTNNPISNSNNVLSNLLAVERELSNVPSPPPNFGIPRPNEKAKKIVMMNIPKVLIDEQVIQLVEPFGKIKSFLLIKDKKNMLLSTGNAVFEYEETAEDALNEDDEVNSDVTEGIHKIIDEAINGLNGLDIGGSTLSVMRAPDDLSFLGLEPPIATNITDENIPKEIIPGITKFLKLSNMVTEDELKDDEEYEDLLLDIKEEIEKYAKIKKVIIPRQKDEQNKVPGLGFIFIEFENQNEAAPAYKVLSGRKFGGNVVEATYIDHNEFAKYAI